jgi:hypothetical protein
MEAFPPQTGNQRLEGGFVLLELLPALVLLLVAVMGSTRLVWTAMEHNRARAVAHWRESMLPVVWRSWAREDSPLAVVQKTTDGHVIRFFPNASWLPSGSTGSGTDTRIVFRREPAQLGHRPAWRIKRLVDAPGGEQRWQDVLIVLRMPERPERPEQ